MEVKKLQFPKSSEEVLLETGKFAILAMQLNAYLPFSVVRGKLCLKYFSTSFTLQVLFYIVLILSWISIALHAEEYMKVRATYTPTEKFIFAMLSITNTLLMTYCRLFCLWGRKSTLEFWKSNVELLDGFVSHPAEKSRSQSNSAVLDNILLKTSASVRTSFSITLVLILGLHLSMYFFQPKDLSMQMLLSLHLIWFTHLSHAGQGIWLCFFLKFYSALFQSIQSRLGSFVEPEINSGGMQSFHRLGEGSFEMELNECYKSYIKVENQVQQFSKHFQKRILAKCFLSFLTTMASIFLVLRSIMELDTNSK